MKSIEYKLGISRLNYVIDILDGIREKMYFQTEEMDEEFNESLEQAIISIEDCIENLEADQAYLDLKDNYGK